ncbi:SgcJ/EcaC family oxidoreductase [Amycolatopsis sp. NPDC021455]|uniref:SgcJ/EcaC family oxidoreductase n=1 Tax=Amycolatopsis sp. NPDC021455 TaxID=3154901 RepID=UPI0033C94F61
MTGQEIIVSDNAWGDAPAILAAHGVEEDTSFYRNFTGADEKAVLAVPQRIQDAWARNDADVFADVFTENGSLLLQDNQLVSREEIRGYMRASFHGALKGARVHGWPLDVKFLAPDVAIAITEGGIIRPGESEIAPENQIRAVWVIARTEDGPRLVSHQSSPVKG